MSVRGKTRILVWSAGTAVEEGFRRWYFWEGDLAERTRDIVAMLVAGVISMGL